MTDTAQPRLIAHRKALDAAGLAIQIALTVPAPLKSIADQIVRSAASVPANIADIPQLGAGGIVFHDIRGRAWPESRPNIYVP